MCVSFIGMKFSVCFLAILSCVGALPADVPFETLEELDLSKIVPKNIYLEPINPVRVQDLPGSRIIGDEEVDPHSAPYQAAVLINGGALCGGSLVSTTLVLTAAHCTDGASFIEVRLGAHRFNTDEDTQVRVTSTNIVSHEDYNVDSFLANDISVVLLPSEVPLSPFVQVIPLAPADAESYAGSRALLTGWGRTSMEFQTVSPILLGVNLNVISNVACGAVYGSVVLPSNICSSGLGTNWVVGACNGDSGGPLVVDGVQVGIVSFGSGNCQAGNPTVHARVSAFRPWLLQNVGL